MNFKDVYKAANDDIKGDREILKSILDGSFTPKKKKNPAKIVYAFGSIAAAAVLLVTVTYMPDIKNTPDEAAPSAVTAKSADSDTVKESDEVMFGSADDGGDKSDNPTADAEPENGRKAEKTAPPVNENNAPEVKNDAIAPIVPEVNENTKTPDENVGESNPMIASSLAPEIEKKEIKVKEKNISTFAEDAVKEENITTFAADAEKEEEPKEKTASGSSARGGGGAANSFIEEVKVPVDEFFTLLGFNKERLSLSGYELKMPDEASVIFDGEGAAFSGSAEFYLKAGDSHISVTLSKGSEAIEKTVTVTDGIVSAYADNGKVSAYVSALNVTEETVSDYMDKIMKEE